MSETTKWTWRDGRWSASPKQLYDNETGRLLAEVEADSNDLWDARICLSYPYKHLGQYDSCAAAKRAVEAYLGTIPAAPTAESAQKSEAIKPCGYSRWHPNCYHHDVPTPKPPEAPQESEREYETPELQDLEREYVKRMTQERDDLRAKLERVTEQRDELVRIWDNPVDRVRQVLQTLIADVRQRAVAEDGIMDVRALQLHFVCDRAEKEAGEAAAPAPDEARIRNECV